MSKLFLSFSVFFLFALFFIFPNHANALVRGQIVGACTENGDTQQFPFGFLCGTYPKTYGTLQVTAVNYTNGNAPVSTGDAIENGSTLKISMKWTDGGGHKPRRDTQSTWNNAPDASEVLPFVTINAVTKAQSDRLDPSNGGSNGHTKSACPGDDSGGPGKIWGDRDTALSYTDPAAVNGINQSPYAYDGTQDGVINCQDHGKMVYWQDTDPKSSETYSFDLRLDDDLVSSRICVRGNLSVMFKDDNRVFPLPSTAGGNPSSNPPTVGGVLTPTANSKISATHLVKQSDPNGLCFSVVEPPKPDNLKATFTASCNRDGSGNFNGYVNKYNPDGSYKDHASNWNFSILELNLGSVTTTNRGNGHTDAQGRYSVDITAPDAQTIFSPDHTDRAFQLAVWDPADPSQVFPLPQVTGVNGHWFLRGASLNCRSHPTSTTATASCFDGIIKGHSEDGDVEPPYHVHVYAHGAPAGTAPDPGEIFNGFTNEVGDFSFDISSLQDGYDYNFAAITEDDAGVVGFSPEYDFSMKGCGHFTLTPSASGSLTPDEENPDTFTGRTDVTPDYSPPGFTAWGASAPKPNLNSTVTQSINKNGGPAIPGITFSPALPANYNVAFSATAAYGIPAGSFDAGDQYCANISLNPGAGIIQNDGAAIRVTSAVTPAAPGCGTVHNKPYFKVYGNGVSAGGGFNVTGSSCTGGGVLAGWNNDVAAATPQDFGAGAQLSALATGPINGFASAQTSIDRSPTELTFANNGFKTIDTSNPRLAGNFDTSQNHCLTLPPAPDYTVDQGLASTANITTLDTAAAAAPKGKIAYKYNNSISLTGGNIRAGHNIALYVNGDVYVGSDVKFAPSGPGNAWTVTSTDTTVPSFNLIATGNIYIDPNVTDLSGVYVAIKNGGGHRGNIYTCGTNAFQPVAKTNLTGCNKQLVIHGSFVADQVNLMRTYGSLRNEKPIEGQAYLPAGGHLGLKHRMIWSELNPATVTTGPRTGLPYLQCVNINEPQEDLPFQNPPHYWYDNYLCLDDEDTANGVQIAWNYGVGPLPSLPYNDNLGFVEHYNEPTSHTWTDNKLFSNAQVRFGTGTSLASIEAADGGYCTQIQESADPDIPNNLPTWVPGQHYQIYVCIDKYTLSAGQAYVAPTAPALSCSNRLSGAIYDPKKSTCAGEIFDFSPEVYLSNPGTKQSDQNDLKYDAVTSLPPVL